MKKVAKETFLAQEIEKSVALVVLHVMHDRMHTMVTS